MSTTVPEIPGNNLTSLYSIVFGGWRTHLSYHSWTWLVMSRCFFSHLTNYSLSVTVFLNKSDLMREGCIFYFALDLVWGQYHWSTHRGMSHYSQACNKMTIFLIWNIIIDAISVLFLGQASLFLCYFILIKWVCNCHKWLHSTGMDANEFPP